MLLRGTIYNRKFEKHRHIQFCPPRVGFLSHLAAGDGAPLNCPPETCAWHVHLPEIHRTRHGLYLHSTSQDYTKPALAVKAPWTTAMLCPAAFPPHLGMCQAVKRPGCKEALLTGQRRNRRFLHHRPVLCATLKPVHPLGDTPRGLLPRQ